MIKYYGNKASLLNNIRAAMPKEFEKYLELCSGTAPVARKLILPGINSTIVDKDRGVVAMLQISKSDPEAFIDAMRRVPYTRDSFELAQSIRDGGYNCSELIAAVAKKSLIDMSFNGACHTYRDIDRHAEDEDEPKRLKYFLLAQQMRERYYRQIAPDIKSFSEELQKVDNIVCDDFFNWLDRLNDSDQFVFIDPPYRPAVRQAKKIGYDQDMSENAHFEMVQKFKWLYQNNRLKSKVMICGYVQEDLVNDMYCQYLLPIGFKLIFLKEIYLPKIFRAGMDKHKQKRYECIFINYEDTFEKDFVPSERIYDYQKVFGNGGISDENA
jgi:site-specific DNA-adenine methylase